MMINNHSLDTTSVWGEALIWNDAMGCIVARLPWNRLSHQVKPINSICKHFGIEKGVRI